MNFVFLSPHFPRNYYRFCQHLRRQGINVLGIADQPWESLSPELRSALTDYYQVSDLHAYDEIVQAMHHFRQHHGSLDRLESFSEYWLETEAALRTDFHIPGITFDVVADMKAKSRMKQKFIAAGVPVVPGRVIRSWEDATGFLAEVGFPVVAKPDVGVGGANTYKIRNQQDVETFFRIKPSVDYFMEPFISGTIETFDGLTDQDGNIVFFASHVLSTGLMDAVNHGAHVYYYSQRQVPADIEEAGRKVVAAYGLKERFFHLEFFRQHKDGSIVVLEANLRPPGGMLPDLFNYANDLDIYAEYANVVAHNRFEAKVERPYHAMYVSRKYQHRYQNSHESIVAECGGLLVGHEAVDRIFAGAMGDYIYILRSPDLDLLKAAAAYIHATY